MHPILLLFLGLPFDRSPARVSVQIVHEQQVKLAVHVEDLRGEDLGTGGRG